MQRAERKESFVVRDRCHDKISWKYRCTETVQSYSYL